MDMLDVTFFSYDIWLGVIIPPPAPNWIPNSGFGFKPYDCTLSTSRSQSSSGMERKPADNSTTSNLDASEHGLMLLDTKESGVPKIFALFEVSIQNRRVVGMCQ